MTDRRIDLTRRTSVDVPSEYTEFRNEFTVEVLRTGGNVGQGEDVRARRNG